MPFCDKKKYKYLFKVAIYLIPALSGSPCTARISLWRRGKQSICEMKWMCNFGFRCDIDFLVLCWLFSFQFCYYCSQVFSVHCECKTLKPPHPGSSWPGILHCKVRNRLWWQEDKEAVECLSGRSDYVMPALRHTHLLCSCTCEVYRNTALKFVTYSFS